ncbi:MFS transporter [Streptomyces sp. BE303]|uniref:MFS transporter n=1 Tax=Streptomyces sp. BE303 TaxID=3002528 RepID=UPI002E79D126|nr:MFS transporter [Streptomyces sp. BE303]MED7951588.1 MFS transporter [Streptomyces sp. BE303]
MTITGATAPDGAGSQGSPSGSADRGGSADTSRPGLPGSYLLWLAGTQVGALGDAALYFALGWAAAAHGGGAAGLVLTAITVSRTVLVLLGGAVADRWGARRVMLTGDAVMLAATLTLAVAAGGRGTPLRLLVVAAVVVGVVDAFYLPASGSMPRRLVEPGQLPRALALRQAGGQVAALLGAPIGGALVAVGGLPVAALADAVSFVVLLLVLLRVRVRGDAEVAPATPETAPAKGGAGERGAEAAVVVPGLLREAAAGVRSAAGDRLLRAALLLAGAAAGVLLPVGSLLVPLLAREHGWGAGAAGLVTGGQGAGVLAVAVLLSLRGGRGRGGSRRRSGRAASGARSGVRSGGGPGAVAGVGLGAAALGVAVLAWAPDPGVAVLGGVVTGVGSGLFAGRLGPLVLAAAPVGHLSRVQALLTLVQSAALVVSTGLLGLLADAAGARVPTVLCASATAAAGLAALGSRALRPSGRPER